MPDETSKQFFKKKKCICIYPFPPLSQYVPPTMKMFIALLLNFSGSIGVFGLFNDLSSHQRMNVAQFNLPQRESYRHQRTPKLSY